MKATVELDGLDQALRSVREMGRRAGGKVLRTAARDGAKVIKRQVAEMVPMKTGKLKRTLRVRKFRTKQRNTVVIGVMTGKRVKLGIKEGAKYYYPAAVEYGTKYRQARPFMRPALRRSDAQARRVFARTLWQGIQQGFVVSGGAR